MIQTSDSAASSGASRPRFRAFRRSISRLGLSLCLMIFAGMLAAPSGAQGQTDRAAKEQPADPPEPMPSEVKPEPTEVAPEPDVEADSEPEAKEDQVKPESPGAQPKKPELQGRRVGLMELSGPLAQSPPPFAWIGPSQGPPTLRSLLKQMDKVAEDPDYRGLVIYLDQPQISLSQASEIGSAMARVRDRGKRVIAFAEQYSLVSYLVACQADEILLQENGQIMLMGLGGEELYLAGMLEKIGAQADFVQVGKYKGAEEPLTRRGPSEEWNENIDMLLDDLYAQALERIGRRRGLSRDEVEAAMRESWTLSDQELVERKLVDRTVPRDLRAATAPSLGQGFFWDDEMGRESGNALKANNPLALFQMLFNPQSARSTKPQLAIVYAIGPIASGESQLEGAFTSETIGSRTIARAMLRAAQRDQVKGVLLRLDSPGGSALASEVIWQAVHTCAQRKPVYISLGGIAASGGYYIASAGTRVYASPSTILGSIGVVGGKITFGGTYEKLGVSVYRRHRGPIAGMFNSVEPFTKDERKLIRKSMQNTYDLFLQRIREGRGKQIGNVSDIAQGRVFTGRQAVNNGMIDKTDNLETALADLAKAANLEEGEYDLIRLPERITFPEFLQQALTNAQGPPNLPAQVKVSSLPLLQAAKKVMGEQRWRAVSRTMTGLLLMQEEPVLTLMPSALVVD